MSAKYPDEVLIENGSTTPLILMLGLAAGALLASLALPVWIPGLANSFAGDTPKAYWYLSRGSALVAYWLLWLSMAFGVIITNKMARVWPGGPTAFDIHEYVSLLGLGFAMFHMFILMGDHYIHYSLFQVLAPFASSVYRPVWVGLGQVSMYTCVVVNASFYIRKRIGNRSWRLVHYASFACYVLALIHGINSGTDTAALWASSLYWVSSIGLLFLVIYRVIVAKFPQPRAH